MSQTFAEFLLDQANTGNEQLAELDDIVEKLKMKIIFLETEIKQLKTLKMFILASLLKFRKV